MCECVCICEYVHVCGVCVHMCLGAAWMKEGPMMRGKVGACHPEPIPRPAALSPRPAPAAPGTLRPGEVRRPLPAASPPRQPSRSPRPPSPGVCVTEWDPGGKPPPQHPARFALRQLIKARKVIYC